ncbi:uncharacterized protein L203_105405 [Cryptococcus depauperatus CBS 7841]|uniref:Uncharacterized protein n=1 Tax=Cryptococcus depauperatus CBS 7841 TaxID=1295531 RepID=A0A1E3ICS3_9TREE|nr:hypothetical protein L203_04081 [Cryptococcus depauperatus CBS 7841]
MMMTSPMIAPHTRSISHTPSPSASPKLVPVASTIAPLSAPAVPYPAMGGSVPTRSFVRGPQQRPYGSPMQIKRELDVETRRFADMLAGVVSARQRRSPGRRDVKKDEKGLIEMVENVSATGSRNVEASLLRGRRSSGLAAGSWEADMAELIVDYPVWSPECFQDLSTLHALRDKTLLHTHALLSYLSNTRSVHATYRLLARSAVAPPGPNSSPSHHGWGCIRLTPSPKDNYGRAGAKVRRASLVHSSKPSLSLSPERTKIRENAVDSDEESASSSRRGFGEFRLKEGYLSDSQGGSDDEDEEETADVMVAREVKRRGGKQGTVFMMTLFGQPALILT